METINGYFVNKKRGFYHWESLLEEWLLLNERYCRIMKTDAAYFYNERALVGTLAAAAWRSGGISLEEFQCLKGFTNRKKRNGRADLYIASESHEEQIEAKYKWVSMNSKDFQGAAIALLSKAVTDAKKTKGSVKDLTAIGVAFLPVYLPKSREKDMDEKINCIISAVCRNKNFHAGAWCFPKEFRKYSNSEKNLMPGVVMVAANVKYA